MVLQVAFWNIVSCPSVSQRPSPADGGEDGNDKRVRKREKKIASPEEDREDKKVERRNEERRNRSSKTQRREEPSEEKSRSQENKKTKDEDESSTAIQVADKKSNPDKKSPSSSPRPSTTKPTTSVAEEEAPPSPTKPKQQHKKPLLPQPPPPLKEKSALPSFSSSSTPNPSSSFDCHICSCSFPTAEERRRHKRREHLVSERGDRYRENKPKTDDKEDKGKAATAMPKELIKKVQKARKRTEYLCLVCLQSFPEEPLIQVHWGKAHCKN